MTQNYLAWAFDKGSPRPLPPPLAAALARHGLAKRWSARGLLLFANADLPMRILASGKGVAIGQLFHRSGRAAAGELDQEISANEAESFTARFWGSYVALARDDEGRVHALRDPSGALACYHASSDGIHYFTSVPHLLVDCGIIHTELDWRAVARSLTQHASRLPDTPLRGIDEVLAGTLLTCDCAGLARRQVWDPWRHAAPKQGNGAKELRETLTSTLEAWGRSTDRPLVEISGGLDSAIVAAGIAPAAPSASLITFAAAPGDPDETHYARALADHLGLPLKIATPRVEDVNLMRSLSCDLPRPNARAFTQAADVQSLGHARKIGADAFISGGGGDDVFCYLRTVLPALDRLSAQGWRAMLRTAMDIAVMNHSTIWQALGLIVHRRLRTRPRKPKLDLRFVSRDVAQASMVGLADDCDYPCPSGKAEHVCGVMTIHNYLEGHARSGYAPILSPLLSQPIVECCLAIPTWQWCEQGRNRAVARRAFEDRLPRILFERRSKGGFDGFCARLLETNRALAENMLMEGVLAGQGLLDPSSLLPALRNPSPPANAVSRLLALIDVESWTRSWAVRPRQRT